jgi:hypothetical protein
MEATFETELHELIAKWQEQGTRDRDILDALDDEIAEIEVKGIPF